MKYAVIALIVYTAIGNILVIQATIRGWKYRPLKGLEGWTTAVGAVVIWPIIVGLELQEIWRRRKD